ncbi:MAG: AbrB/MazE/SpoVT family DNA-binding domain-containing protein [Spirochaetota bacterium]
MSSYEIEGIATVDSRGQIVLPKSTREALGLGTGSKLAVVIKTRGGSPCCITLMPAAQLESRVREVIDSTEPESPDTVQ